MKIMTLNCGSSSVKYSLWNALTKTKLCEGIVERVTIEGGFIRHQLPKVQEIVQYQKCPESFEALNSLNQAHHLISRVASAGDEGLSARIGTLQ